MNFLKKLHYLFPFVFLAFMFSCVEEYWPDLNFNRERLLIVEGNINNKPGPYTIQLSKLKPMDSIPDSPSSIFGRTPVRNALVEIYDDEGNSEILNEVATGIYKTLPEGIQGETGKSYKLRITTSQGLTYESAYEVIPNSLGIEDLSTINDTISQGLRFTVTPEHYTEQTYFYWYLEETYEYHAPLISPCTHPEDYIPGQIGSICWMTKTIKNIYLVDTDHYNSALIDYPFHTIPYGNIRIRIKYSLLAEQHIISEDTYNYFREIKMQNSISETDLYTTIPYPIRGNMRNINNSSEIVLGYFYASGLSTKRIFSPPDPEPLSQYDFDFLYCTGMGLVCNECFRKGGTTQRPDFWD